MPPAILAKRKAALTLDPLQELVTTCMDGGGGQRDQALPYFGFSSGGRRRSEIAACLLDGVR
jgi:hypothetical protein